MPNHDLTAPTEDDRQPASPEIVMFLLGPDGQELTGESPPPARTLGEVYRAWRAVLDEEREEEDFHRFRPVARQVQGIGRPGKQGYRDEIVVTLRSRPVESVTQALRSDIFDPPPRWLLVEPGSREVGRYELAWRVELRVWPWRTRAAKLRLYASPSLNVTVLSLFPRKPRNVAKRRFLRRGLRVMNALRDRIDDGVQASAPASAEPVGPPLG